MKPTKVEVDISNTDRAIVQLLCEIDTGRIVVEDAVAQILASRPESRRVEGTF